MKTKTDLIKALQAILFGFENCDMDLTGIKGIVIIVYSPWEIGGDEWKIVVNGYAKQSDAFNRYAETPCYNSVCITWRDDDTMDIVLPKISSVMTEFINDINEQK